MKKVSRTKKWKKCCSYISIIIRIIWNINNAGWDYWSVRKCIGGIPKQSERYLYATFLL